MDRDFDAELELAIITLQSHALRGRVLASVGASRYAPFAKRVAHFFRIPRDEAEAALDRLLDPAAWSATETHGMQMLSVEATTSGQAMFLQGEAGLSFPTPTRGGEEQLLILEGSLLEDSQLLRNPGDLIIKLPESLHAYAVTETDRCVWAYRIEWGNQLS